MPFKGWFGPKLIGYGFGPRSWQGWLATGVVLVVVVGSRFVQPETYGLPHWARPALVLAYCSSIWRWLLRPTIPICS
jgi:hypothetical protein